MQIENKRIKEVRKILELNQEEFAKILGTTQSKICKLEKSQKIDMTTLLLLEKKFNINKDWIMTGDGKMFLDGGIIDGEDYKQKEQEMQKAQEPTREYQLLKNLDDSFDDELLDITINKIKNLSNKNKKIAYHKISAIIEELS